MRFLDGILPYKIDITTRCVFKSVLDQTMMVVTSLARFKAHKASNRAVLDNWCWDHVDNGRK